MNTEEVDDYLDYVKEPMDFEKMHIKLDDGEYKSAQVRIKAFRLTVCFIKLYRYGSFRL